MDAGERVTRRYTAVEAALLSGAPDERQDDEVGARFVRALSMAKGSRARADWRGAMCHLLEAALAVGEDRRAGTRGVREAILDGERCALADDIAKYVQDLEEDAAGNAEAAAVDARTLRYAR